MSECQEVPYGCGVVDFKLRPNSSGFTEGFVTQTIYGKWMVEFKKPSGERWTLQTAEDEGVLNDIMVRVAKFWKWADSK